ncbi:hypothetical protein [Streptomyces sp. NPDC052496]
MNFSFTACSGLAAGIGLRFSTARNARRSAPRQPEESSGIAQHAAGG